MRQFFAVAGFVLLASACGKQQTEPLRKFISFQLDGQVILSEKPSAILTPANLTDNDPDNDYPRLTITGNGNHGEGITIALVSQNNPLTTGTYSDNQQGNGMVMTFSDIPQQLQADNTHGAFALSLNTVQDSLIEGTFSGILVDTSGAISQKVVKDGFIRAIISKQ